MLIERANLSVLVIDMQSALMPAIAEGDQLIVKMAAFLQAMTCLDVPIVVTEHCAEKIGHTVAGLPLGSAQVVQKRSFAATASLSASHIAPGSQVVVVGCEAHVCVLQTVAGLIAAGRTVWVVDELVGSRFASDRHLALARMQHMGADRVSSEMVCFECLRSADHAKFPELIGMIRARESD